MLSAFKNTLKTPTKPIRFFAQAIHGIPLPYSEERVAINTADTVVKSTTKAITQIAPVIKSGQMSKTQLFLRQSFNEKTALLANYSCEPDGQLYSSTHLNSMMLECYTQCSNLLESTDAPNTNELMSSMLRQPFDWYQSYITSQGIRPLGVFRYQDTDFIKAGFSHDTLEVFKKEGSTSSPICSDFAFYSLNEQLTFDYIFKTKLWPPLFLNNTSEQLAQWGYEPTESPENGDLVIYLQENNSKAKFKHAGIFVHGEVNSKWGMYPNVYAHALEQVPMCYGNHAYFFKKTHYPNLVEPTLKAIEKAKTCNHPSINIGEMIETFNQAVHDAQQRLFDNDHFGTQNLKKLTLQWNQVRQRMTQQPDACDIDSLEHMLKNLKI